jgi:hypothetical protein
MSDVIQPVNMYLICVLYTVEQFHLYSFLGGRFDEQCSHILSRRWEPDSPQSYLIRAVSCPSLW